ncbi:MAG: T9SS type A sorting domain-containing protein [Bacteroidota bacterium]
MRILYTLLLSLLFSFLAAQTFTEPVEIINNDLSITIRPDGFIPSIKYFSPSAGDWVGIADSSGFWIGGLDPAANPKLSISDRGDIQAGLFGTDNLQGIWRVTREEMLEYFSDYNDNFEIDEEHPSIFAWPARGNPLFSEYNNGMELPTGFNTVLAPFWNQDSDFLSYNPLAGDFPFSNVFNSQALDLTIPKENYWLIFQSGFGPDNARLSLALNIYFFECAGELDNLDESIFVHLTLKNRGQEDLINIFPSLKIDSKASRFMLTDSVNSSVVLYPPYGLAENCNLDSIGVGQSLGVRVPRGALDEFGQDIGMSNTSVIYDSTGNCGLFYPEATFYPNEAIAYYDRLRGLWNDGSTMQSQGDGYDQGVSTVRYAFPGNLDSITSSWTEINANQLAGERIALIMSGDFTLLPGAVNEMTFQISALELPEEVGVFEQVDSLNRQMIINRDEFGDFSCSSIMTSTSSPEINETISIAPNPAWSYVQISTESNRPVRRATIFDMQGRKIIEQDVFHSPASIEVGHLPAGMYLVQAQIGDGVVVERFVKR